jgi:hypothetical protein
MMPASAPMAAHMPVPKSSSEVPTRVGGLSSSPFMAMRPEKACTMGSKPGLSLRGPVRPSAQIAA